ncbi:unnamed protein product [Cuscuta epithymum]|uniref:Uncharacterized protein n=1 Tax=Cuscuta epithymum TaxID=186058 RepID=A0AAV0F7C4_9ASTE|nr:unnamed protein product [Cuscuta epithymum]
MLKLLFCMET